MSDVQFTTLVLSIILGVLLFIDVIVATCFLKREDDPHNSFYYWIIGVCTVFALVVLAAIGGINTR